MIEEEDAPPADAGTPAWVMTFADLMSLLMCFFVLLLAFSEMDAQKFKQLSGSMKEAFGVQAELKADYIPKGTSVVTTEFSPGRPDKTTLDEVRQHTIDSSKSTLDFKDKDAEGGELADESIKKAEEDLKRLLAELSEEIEEQRLSIRREGTRIIIQIHEQGSFSSGYANVRQDFLPTLEKIAIIGGSMKGIVQVTGHTDDIPISNARFRSNWELSASRAVSVAHQLMKNERIDPHRFVVTGLASTQPRVPNTSPENRAQNRRVEINIVRGIELDQFGTRDDVSTDDTPSDAEDSTQTAQPDTETDLS